jgi:opacity protein-like surface antigen
MALTVTTEKSGSLTIVTYDNIDTADTDPSSIEINGTNYQVQGKPTQGFFHAYGTFGGGTAKLQGSNDDTNWVDLDIAHSSTALALTAAGGAEFSASCRYIRPLITGGTGDDIDVSISYFA